MCLCMFICMVATVSSSTWDKTKMDRWETQNLKKFNISEGNSFHVAEEGGPWRAIFREGLDVCTKKRVEMEKAKHSAAVRQGDMRSPNANFTCGTCWRSFSRQYIASTSVRQPT